MVHNMHLFVFVEQAGSAIAVNVICADGLPS